MSQSSAVNFEQEGLTFTMNKGMVGLLWPLTTLFTNTRKHCTDWHLTLRELYELIFKMPTTMAHGSMKKKLSYNKIVSVLYAQDAMEKMDGSALMFLTCYAVEFWTLLWLNF